MNWTDDRTLQLLGLIDERKNIIKGALSPTLTAARKEEAWEEITAIINASDPLVIRTKDQCQKRWYTVQSKAKEKITAYKKAQTGTGK